ncbi:MAG: AI-2E family transporter [Casimicrobiaceae bacterium]
MLPADPPPAAPPPPTAVERARTLRRIQYLWVVGAVATIAALLHWLGPILTPFMIGLMFAYLGNPVVNWFQRRRTSRTIGTLLVMAVMFLLLLILALVLWPLIHAEATQLYRRLPQLVGMAYAQFGPWLSENFGIELEFDLASVKQMVADNVAGAEAMSLKVLSGLKAGGTLVLGILINLVLIPVVTFYLLRDWNSIVLRVGDLMPRRWLPKVSIVAKEIDAVLAEFVRGQVSVMVVLAVYYAIGLWLVGLQFAVPIGVLTGLLVFIPYVGFGLGLILGIVAALLQWHGLPGFAAVMAVYGIGQLLEGYVLIPWLVGDRIGLHPLAVIFALLAFGHLFGFAGVLIALPASAALLVGLRHLRAEYHDSELYR